jgi:hypothetical protein
MLSSVTLILIVLPVLYQWAHRREHQSTTDRTTHGTMGS